MFTGIITDKGSLRGVEDRGERRFTIDTSYDTESIDIGASIACSGACLTVVDKGAGWFAADVSVETLSKTTLGQWREGDSVNLERALKVGDELGGHLVSGHEPQGRHRLPDRGDSLRGGRIHRNAYLGACQCSHGGSRAPGTGSRTFRCVPRRGGDRHVLRFWESKFSQVKPLKRGGGRRYYRPEDIALLRRIRNLLYEEGYTIKGVQKLLRDGRGKIQLSEEQEQGTASPAGENAESRKELKAVLDELVEIRDLLRSVAR